MSRGGAVPWVCETNPITMRVLRVLSPDVFVASICGGPPEYVMSAGYVRRHGRGALAALDAIFHREINIWENEGGQLLSGANERG